MFPCSVPAGDFFLYTLLVMPRNEASTLTTTLRYPCHAEERGIHTHVPIHYSCHAEERGIHTPVPYTTLIMPRNEESTLTTTLRYPCHAEERGIHTHVPIHYSCHAEERGIYTPVYAHQFPFRKSHLGFTVFINASFFALDQPFSSFSLAIAFVMY